MKTLKTPQHHKWNSRPTSLYCSIPLQGLKADPTQAPLCIGDFVDTPLGITMEIYELSTYQGEERATGKFKKHEKWLFLTYPINGLRKSNTHTHSVP